MHYCCLSVFMLLAVDGDLNCLKTEQPTLYDILLRQAVTALTNREQALEKVTTPELARAHQAKMREVFLKALGPFPAKTPLKAQVVGRLKGEDYHVEKIIFESQPNHHVTATLYLPNARPPYPGVIIPCGHSSNGKGAEAYQRVGILLAKNGIAGLCYDPIGQGERYQIMGAAAAGVHNPVLSASGKKALGVIPGKPEFNSVEEHTLMGIGSILVGTNTARYRIWDGIRALDYLESRPDIDPKKLGCTGNSGGGTLTSYLMALDDRIVCAAPSCYLTTYRKLLSKAGPQDAEQNIFGQIALGMDEGDYVLMRAPRPTCLLAGTQDSTFDITGTWDIFREAKRFYARFGLPERVSMVEADAPHGFTIQLREGAVHWMRRWLLGKDEAVREGDFPAWNYDDLLCTPKGQVMLLAKERSVFDLNRAIEKRLASERAKFWSETAKEKGIERVREVAGIRPLGKLPEPKVAKVGVVERDGYRIDKLVFEREDGVSLPALLFVPGKNAGEPCLYLHGEGKAVDAAPGGAIEKLVVQGQTVLAVDLRGWGESLSKRKRDWGGALFGPSVPEFFLAYLMGQSLVGQRTEDALVCARYLAKVSGNKRGKIEVVGIGRAGIPALHAAALEPGLISRTTLRRTLASWSSVLDTPFPRDQLASAIHGVLAVYDLPDLIRMLPPENIRIEQTVAAGEPPA